ncbi:MAG: diguanylate cyclase [Gordonia sp. (in: high G+C Gram-positive bacteria)]
MDRPDLSLTSSLGPISRSHRRILAIYLSVTTGLYAVGVIVTLFGLNDDLPLANPAGGLIAIGLGVLALVWLAHRPDRPTPAILAACAATPIVMAFHVLVNAELLCVIAAMLMSMYVRVSYPFRLAWSVIGALTVACLAALAVAPAPILGLGYLIVAVTVPTAAATFGQITRTLVVAACTDPLTEAFNRSGWELACDALLTRMTSRRATAQHIVAVIVVDVDNFKSLNDTQGHAAGDRFLIDLVRQAADVLPRQAIIARMGGDEFAICVAVSDTDTLTTLLQTLQRRLLRTTVGAANAPAATANVGDLYVRADTELTIAKRHRTR